MAFNNWPYTNFQDLNLGWILNKVKEALTKATEALTSTTGFDDRITTAENNSSEANTKATEALATANTANGKATEALSTANNASDTANTASTNATQARTDAARALSEVGGAVGSYKIFVNAQNQCSHAGESIDAADVVSALTDGRDIFVERADADNPYSHIGYQFAYYDINNSTTPATTLVFFDRLISYAGENAVVERMVMRNGSNTASFTTIQTLASKSYVDSHGGGGGTSIQDIIDTVNDGDTNALLKTAQTLSSAEKAQVKQNLGISDSGGSYSPYLIPVTMHGGVYSTTATGEDVLDNILDCRIIFNGLHYYPIGSSLSGPFGHAYFACIDPSASGKYDVDIFDVELNGANNACTVTKYDKDVSLNGAVPYIPIGASSSSIPALQPNTLVEYTGDATNLSITLATPSDNSISNEYHFIFHSGSTPTTLTIPNTVRQPDGFTVEANHVYEVSILNNNMTAQGWEVSA